MLNVMIARRTIFLAPFAAAIARMRQIKVLNFKVFQNGGDTFSILSVQMRGGKYDVVTDYTDEAKALAYVSECLRTFPSIGGN